MLHDEHRDVDDVVAFLQRWLLVSDDRARQSLRFLSSPLWRAYTSTYVEGYRLLRGWLEARPAEMTLAQRFGRLLTNRSSRRVCGSASVRSRQLRRPCHWALG